MENVVNLAPSQAVMEEFDQHYLQQSNQEAAKERTEEKQSKLSKLLSYLANLETGFPLSGA